METQTDYADLTANDGIVEIAGERYMRDAKGALVPINLVKPLDKLKDELVRKLVAQANELHMEMGRVKSQSMADLASLQELAAQEYGTTLGGAKGNVEILTLDGTLRVKLQVADLIQFGLELQVAKKLVDACLTDWSAGTRDELRAIVNRAFDVDKAGKVNTSGLLMLLRVEITDKRWQSAMQAIRDSISVVGSKSYMRFYERDTPDGAWSVISLDMASI